MKTPEEFAWSLYESMDFQDHSWKDEEATQQLIAERDEEIREATIAELELRVVTDLSELTWQTAECEEDLEGECCQNDMHCPLPETERIQVRPGVYEQRDTRPRRLVGPWVKS